MTIEHTALVARSYKFWFNMRAYTTDKPSMTIAELKAIANASPGYHTCQDMFGNGPDRYFGDGEAVSLTGEPHFYTFPPATTHRGMP